MADHRHTVLLAEDDADSREAMALLLEHEGFEVVTAADGNEAFARLETGTVPCLIVLDLMMPRASGADFRRRQQAHPTFRRYPVAVFSGVADLKGEAEKLGIGDFVSKPVDPARILAIVHRHCG